MTITVSEAWTKVLPLKHLIKYALPNRLDNLEVQIASTEVLTELEQHIPGINLHEAGDYPHLDTDWFKKQATTLLERQHGGVIDLPSEAWFALGLVVALAEDIEKSKNFLRKT